MQLPVILNKFDTLPSLAKVGLVVGGYVVAIIVAFGVVSIYISQTSGPDRDTYAGMYAFGDCLLFLAVFGLASIVPTALTLLLLTRSTLFWATCSVLGSRSGSCWHQPSCHGIGCA